MNTTKTKKSRNSGFKFRTKNGASRPQGQQRSGGKKKATSTIEISQLVKKAKPINSIKYEAKRTFDDMPLDVNLKANLFDKGFKKPSQIQDETLEHLLEGRNMIGIANTGTGKTAAFLLPIIQDLLQTKAQLTALVIVPTRELALQVETEFKSLTKGLGLYASSFIGGTSVDKDVNQLRKQNHIIIGTPGRLKDLIDRKALRLDKIPVLVLDEFDRMLDMGFVNDIKRIVAGMTKRSQTMLFSATIDHSQRQLIDSIMHNPVEIKVSVGNTSSDQVDQDIIRVTEGEDKTEVLIDMLQEADFNKVLVFAETRRWVMKITKKLSQAGVKADQIHGDKSQNYRVNALNRFKSGKIQVLVATDVAARGIDVTDISHVINYSIPLTYDSYVHRIGRTGRAGKMGKALTFVN